MNEETRSALRELAIMITVAIALGAAVVWAILTGTSKSEVAECAKWSQEADAYPDFFLATWQKDQCDAHSIFINATVKK